MQTREHSRPSRRHPLAVVVLTLVGAVAAVALFVAPASASSSSVVPEATTPLVPGILGVVIGLVVGLLLGLRLAAQRRPDPVAVRPAAADDQVLAELRKVNERLSVLETPVAGAAFAAQPDPRTTAPFAALPDDVPEAAPTPAPTLATAPPPAPAPAPSVEDDWTPPEPDAVPEWQPTLPDPEPPEPKDAVTVLEEWTGEDRFQTGSHPAVTDEIAETAPADVEAPAALEETQRFVFPDPLTPEPSDSVAAEPDDVPASVPTVEPQIDTPEPSPLIADATWEQPAAAETTPAEPDDVPDTHDVSEPLTSSTGGWQGNAPRAGDLGGGDATDEAAETPEPASRIADWRWGAETAAEDAPTEDPLTTPAWADVTA
ncbi:MAG: hypothetical protein JWO46_1301, partial [Nocardioidaceae bacterium]|nr:hypothetical protein [Nocardioidaceae bacterium]